MAYSMEEVQSYRKDGAREITREDLEEALALLFQALGTLQDYALDTAEQYPEDNEPAIFAREVEGFFKRLDFQENWIDDGIIKGLRALGK